MTLPHQIPCTTSQHNRNSMQTVVAPSRASVCSHSSRRAPVAFIATRKCSRARSVQVYAKGKTSFRSRGGIPGSYEMIKQEPPVPEVDPVNVEFVVFFRAKKFTDQKTGLSMGPTPWYPLSIFKGQQAANYMVKLCETELGKRLYSKTLIRQVGLAIYKERPEIEKQLKSRQEMKGISTKDLEYAFKIRDKANPKDWLKADNIIAFPPESELQGTALDALKTFFSGDNLSKLFQAPASAQ